MIDFHFNLKGRVSRKGFLLAFFLPMVLITQILPLVAGSLLPAAVFMVIGVFYVWPSNVAIPVKRFHDMGVTGWYQLGVVVLILTGAVIFGQGALDVAGGTDAFATMTPEESRALIAKAVETSGRAQLGVLLMALVSFGQFVLFAFMPGQRGANRFGKDPLDTPRGFSD